MFEKEKRKRKGKERQKMSVRNCWQQFATLRTYTKTERKESESEKRGKERN